MTYPDSPPGAGPGRDGVHLRLLWPQWQGAGTSSVRELAPEFPFDIARRGYAVGSAVLQAVLPANDGPTVTVPVTMSDAGLAERDGVEAKAVILAQLARALEVIGQHDPARIATLGGECSVSVAPFSHLARRYGEDLAIIWIDSHPDIGTARRRRPRRRRRRRRVDDRGVHPPAGDPPAADPQGLPADIRTDHGLTPAHRAGRTRLNGTCRSDSTLTALRGTGWPMA